MKQITVKSGKGELILEKSKRLVGLKATDPGELRQKEYVGREILSDLGGFNVVELNKEGENIDSKLDEVRAESDVEVGTHVYFAPGDNKPVIPTGRIYITFEEGVTQPEQEMVLEEFALEQEERRNELLVVAMVTPASPNPLKCAAAMQALSLVARAEPDLDMPLDEYAFMAPRDELVTHQWHLRNLGYVPDANYRLKYNADAKVIDAWERLDGLGSRSVKVAVIDNGFDTSHPDLAGKIVSPYNVHNKNNILPQGDTRFTHGTPCASVAISASNGRGIVGVAPDAQFIPVHGTSFSVADTEDMFQQCVRRGADIISCSWGTTDSRYSLGYLKEQAIARAAREGRNGKGCVILFAAGNDGLDYLNFYAAHPDVIAVAASTSQDTYPYYSNRGRELSVCAPSNGDWPIIAARAWWDPGYRGEVGNYRYWRDGRSRGDRYKHFGGTSSATPLVAGICALMLSANPDLTAREVKEILQQTADKIGNSWEYNWQGFSTKYGYGRVNADRAVAEALRRRDRNNMGVNNPVTPPPPIVAPPQAPLAPTPTPPQPGPAPTPAPAPPTTGTVQFDVKKLAYQGYSVQIGAFFDYGNVLEQTEKLKNQFSAPVIVNISQSRGRNIYRIAVGNFRDREDARRLMDRVRASGYDPFIRNLRDWA